MSKKQEQMSEEQEQMSEVQNLPKKKMAKKFKILIGVLVSLLVIVLAAGITVFAMFKHYYGLSNGVTDPESIEIASIPDDKTEEAVVTLSPEEASSLAEEQSRVAASLAELDQSQTFNLLLVGVDRRDASWNGNSDSMMLLSVNYATKNIYVTSFMRDLYADIPGVGGYKLNRSYALGGAPLLVQTLETNYHIDINNYAWIDFDGLTNMINAIDGVDVELAPAEAEKCGIGIAANQVCHLNGEQALIYARDRSSGGNDYARTEHQRKIIASIINKVKAGGLGSLSDAATSLLPYVTHNMEEGTVLNLMTQLPIIAGYAVNMQRIPLDGTFTSSNEMLVPDFGANINFLYSTIYAQ